MAAPSFSHLQATDYGRIHEKQHIPLQELTRPHIESFNYFLQEGLALSARQIPPVEFSIGKERVSLAFRDATIGVPEVSHTNRHAATLKVFPSECRQRGTTYRSKIQANVSWVSSSGREGVKDVVLGEIPIMIKSDRCNLNNLSPAQLIQHQEEAEEMGGYFIVNGIERVVRMLVMPRRNYPMAINRPRWKHRGRFFTEFGVTMRCVQNDQTSGNLILHYLNNGSVVLSFTCLKEMFFISLVTLLKALVDTTDQHIYNEILKGKEDDTFLIGCVTEMLRYAQAKDLTTQQNILDFIGEQFRTKLRMPEWYSAEKVAKFLLKQHICVHLDSNYDKFNTLILMARKLFFFARGHCAADNVDSPMNQEVLLAGHLYQMVLKEKMQSWLIGLRIAFQKKATIAASNFILNNGRGAICYPPQVPCPVGGGCGILCNFRDECVESSDEKNCNCSVFVNKTDEMPVEIVKCSGASRVISVLAVDSGYWMTCDSSGTIPRIRTSLYKCDDGLDCYNPGSSIPKPCKTVYSGCYLSPFGQDYKGNHTLTECLPWSHPNVSSYGYAGFQYWELEGLEPNSTVTHNYCRNPGGLRDGPWCFAGNQDVDEVHHRCPVGPPARPFSSCHNATLNISIALEDNGRSNASQGRLQITTSEGVIGTISDQSWTINDTIVVCRQLGFSAGAVWDEVTDFGPGSGPVLITDVQCTGFENSLIDCFYRVATGHVNDHSYDVGIVCNTTGYLDRSNISNDGRSRRRRDADSVLAATGSSEASPLIPSLPFDLATGGMRRLKNKKNPARTTFSCGDGVEIPLWQICNKFPDCVDGSDEWATKLNCDDILTECNLHEFQCKEQDSTGGIHCIPKIRVCDGYNDCTNRQPVSANNPPAWDEKRCPQFDEPEPPGYYRCHGSSGKAGHFIHKRDMCNTVNDCVEGDDERECLRETPKVKEDPFKNPYWYRPYKKLLNPKYHHLWEAFQRNYSKPPFDRVADFDPPNWNSFMTFSAMPDYSDLVNVLDLSGDEIAKYGHQKEDFILQCTYEQKKCNMSLITVIQNDKYGNCFTFNNKNQSILASKTGSRNGLQMTLFLEQSEYISIYGQEAGVRVSITPTHIRPSPTDIGITIKPGTVTSIGLRYNDVIRKGHPYGKCTGTVKNTLIIANGEFRKTNPSEKYDRGLCKKTCVHKHILENCGCSDTLELNGPRCRLLNDTQDVCKHLIYFLHHHDRLRCNCPEQCSAIYYTKTSSMSVWPSRRFAKLLLRNLYSINNKTNHLNEDNIYENIARLEIYYEELNYERTEEKPSYQESSLFGDIGGIVGLYIGFSLITVCEFIGLILKLIKNNCLAPATSL